MKQNYNLSKPVPGVTLKPLKWQDGVSDSQKSTLNKYFSFFQP